MSKSGNFRLTAVVLLVLTLAVGGWALTYPPPDPKSIPYILWKAGLYKMDLNLAVSTMIGDSNRDTLVIGKTKEQLRNKFQELRTVSQVSEYYRDGYNHYWQGKDVLFIRDSPWMVVFDHDRATELVFMKGY